MTGEVIGHASAIELIWLLVCAYALVQSGIKLQRSVASMRALRNRRLNGIRHRIVRGHIRSEVGRLMLYLGAFATGVYAAGLPSSRTSINWFAVGMILILLYKVWDTHMSNRDTDYVVRELERRYERTAVSLPAPPPEAT